MIGATRRTSYGTRERSHRRTLTGSPNIATCYHAAQCLVRLPQGLTMLRQCTTCRSVTFD